jgi:hypothetical protein
MMPTVELTDAETAALIDLRTQEVENTPWPLAATRHRRCVYHSFTK